MNESAWNTGGSIDEVLAKCDKGLFSRSFMQYKLIGKNSRYHYIDLVDADGPPLRLLGISNKGRFSHEMRISSNGLGGARLENHWDWLLRGAAARKVHTLSLEILDQAKVEIPRLAKETFRNAAVTHVIDLQKDAKYASNHRRNLKKASRNQVRLVDQPREPAIDAHIRVWEESMGRRRDRGEDISEAMPAERVRRYLKSGRGRLYQCAVDGEVVSSDLVISVGPYAFYDSGGSSAFGMSIGSSYLLMDAIIGDLRARNAVSLNLGVTTRDRAGLIRFKEGWGADQFEYSTAGYSISRSLKERVTSLLTAGRNP